MFHFLSISNLNTSKGTFLLLDVAVLLLKQTSDFHVHFVGAPTAEISEGRIQEEIANRGLQKVVTYHGRLYGDDKEALFDEADCFVHPTLDDCFPLVILEAMQHSLPVIATPVGAIPDMVINGETGVLVPANDTQALADEMLKLVRNLEHSLKMGKLGYLRVMESYTLQTFNETMIKILAE